MTATLFSCGTKFYSFSVLCKNRVSILRQRTNEFLNIIQNQTYNFTNDKSICIMNYFRHIEKGSLIHQYKPMNDWQEWKEPNNNTLNKKRSRYLLKDDIILRLSRSLLRQQTAYNETMR